jgi:hypothetical protein
MFLKRFVELVKWASLSCYVSASLYYGFILRYIMQQHPVFFNATRRNLFENCSAIVYLDPSNSVQLLLFLYIICFSVTIQISGCTSKFCSVSLGCWCGERCIFILCATLAWRLRIHVPCHCWESCGNVWSIGEWNSYSLQQVWWVLSFNPLTMILMELSQLLMYLLQHFGELNIVQCSNIQCC